MKTHSRSAVARSVTAGLNYCASVFAAGFVLGTVRVLLLLPAIGETLAVTLELPVMLALSWFACRRITAHFGIPKDLPCRGLMGGIAFGLLMAAELGVSMLLFDRSLEAHLKHYLDVPALLGLAGQIAFAAFPAIQAGYKAARTA